jgi:thiol-disulfide isomerase/thioredoxin
MPATTRRFLLIILSLVSVHSWDLPATADPPPDVQLRTVSYRELGEVVKAQRGKVVVVDVWADFCLPCKREFPNLVRLHERYAADGLVCVSVSVDRPAKHDAALAFLTKQKATFANYRLSDADEVWQKAWKINGPPAVFVFDRDGKRAGKFVPKEGDDSAPFAPHEEVEALVRKLLRADK